MILLLYVHVVAKHDIINNTAHIHIRLVQNENTQSFKDVKCYVTVNKVIHHILILVMWNDSTEIAGLELYYIIL